MSVAGEKAIPSSHAVRRGIAVPVAHLGRAGRGHFWYAPGWQLMDD